MFLKKKTTAFTKDYSEQIEKLKQEIDTAEAIVVGAGAGISTSAGMDYGGERFEKYFSDFRKKYGITDMYSGGFYPYDTLEEYWAWWSRHILINRYEASIGKPFKDLLEILKGKDYFVLTTNVDHQFQLAGFDKKRLFYTQGDYGLWQCSRPCHDKTYDNEAAVRQMAEEQKDMKIPMKLIPKCPVCGTPMTMNLRCDMTFVQDEGWYKASDRYKEFLQRNRGLYILFLELGVGANTPGIIKYPFWQMTWKEPKAVYACINYGEAFCPQEIENRAVCINADIGQILEKIADQKNN
ncbi:SIR2 family NAD-dependent protein deacylase [Sellimonas caecigallum]|uniref:Sir2 silent information regulator family NAD-dependent deacetylase n=1 Tax=Sellimonas caecigallum TaxID=2592333 RepID=A0ABS7L3U0_9FIRM|nr:Sir2 silent information regulator family NAD-dependent deacetylase [Sellimonas caecigallum]MBY0757708.1 Sir2 silent information regulator family NAD-dependent deacetylase [Sellimonas caecigallum]